MEIYVWLIFENNFGRSYIFWVLSNHEYYVDFMLCPPLTLFQPGGGQICPPCQFFGFFTCFLCVFCAETFWLLLFWIKMRYSAKKSPKKFAGGSTQTLCRAKVGSGRVRKNRKLRVSGTKIIFLRKTKHISNKVVNWAFLPIFMKIEPDLATGWPKNQKSPYSIRPPKWTAQIGDLGHWPWP